MNQNANEARLERWLERSLVRAQSSRDPRLVSIFEHAARNLAGGDARYCQALAQLKRVPVTIDEFVGSPDFLGRVAHVWPGLMADLRALNPDVLTGEPGLEEALLGGATGIGKSTLARITLLYQLYLLTCFRNPRRLYGLDRQTILVFPLQSVSPEVTRRVLYEPLRDMFEAMPFVRRHLEWNRRKTRSLELAGGIHVTPLLANPESLLGQAVPGAILDEVNFLRVVERSKRMAGPRGLGGRYDQAEALCRELVQRRRSRFDGAAISIGCLIFSSSAHYKDDFLERRMREAETNPRSRAFISRRKRWEAVPRQRYGGATFRLLVGTERHPTRILADNEAPPEGARVEAVPVEHLSEFERDPAFALRTLAGIAADTIHAFIDDPARIVEAFEHGTVRGLEPWVEKSDVVLARDGYPRWRPGALPQDRATPRYAHIDLSHTRDACGVVVLRQDGFLEVPEGGDGGIVERKPRFAVEVAVSVEPDPSHELQFGELRSWLLQLVSQYRFDLCAVSLDGYQSTESRQVLRRMGIRSVEISVDRTPAPYHYLRECLHEGRLAIVDSPRLARELRELEYDPYTGRVDHPPRGSKDVADALCGALTAASGNRSLRHRVGYVDEAGETVERPRAARRPSGYDRPAGCRIARR